MKKIIKVIMLVVLTFLINQGVFAATSTLKNEDNNYVKINSHIKKIMVPSDYSTLDKAIKAAKEGDTIVLDDGIYNINHTIKINKKNITIASKYILDGNKKHIDNTILKGSGSSKKQYLYGEVGKSKNLRIIGLTFRDMYKPVVFNSYGEVHYSKFLSENKNISDAISFESKAVGGVVTNCYTLGTRDEPVDIDSTSGGTFIVAHNNFNQGHDDALEIRSYKYTGKTPMIYKIHDKFGLQTALLVKNVTLEFPYKQILMMSDSDFDLIKYIILMVKVIFCAAPTLSR